MPLSRRAMLRHSGLTLAGLVLGACGRADVQPRAQVQSVQDEEALTRVATQLASLPGFEHFRDHVTLTQDDHTFWIASNGLPAHGMMVGIRSWQQQVPLPQSYHGSNAWRLPRKPELASTPISARTGLYRGAIALAVNGVPIFNALNNRGEDAFLAGELDEWGGHAGRADDYHYHVAPLHLAAVVGPDQPIAYALDGFPIYGLTEPDGSPVRTLDEYNGHADSTDGYHYHATTSYPYINGGLRGVVNVANDQVEPQPHTTALRPALTPLRGATITAFEPLTTQGFRLSYVLADQTHTIMYAWDEQAVRFTFEAETASAQTTSYRRPTTSDARPQEKAR